MVDTAYRQYLYNIFILCLNTYLLLYLFLILGLGETTLQNDTFNPVFVAFYCLNSLLKPILCVHLPHLTSQRADFLQCVVLCTFLFQITPQHLTQKRKVPAKSLLLQCNAVEHLRSAPSHLIAPLNGFSFLPSLPAVRHNYFQTSAPLGEPCIIQTRSPSLKIPAAALRSLRRASDGRGKK